MRFFRFTLFLLVALSLAGKKKSDDTKTQKLAEPLDPPAFATGDATRLVFHLSPLSGKGLLSQQTRDALAAILKANSGATVIHLRAFVAGSGDLRRIPQIVSEVFSKKHQPLPSVSVIQIGALPLEGAQIVIEAISEARKATNPSGVSFIAAQDSMEKLAAKAGSANVLSVSCFVNDIGRAAELTRSLTTKFPAASIDVMQTQRQPLRPITACEAVVRGGKAGHYVFTGTQAAFGFEAKDAALAFQRVGRELTAAGVAPDAVVMTNVYALTKPIADLALRSSTMAGEVSAVPVEGVASSDASFSLDVIASKP